MPKNTAMMTRFMPPLDINRVSDAERLLGNRHPEQASIAQRISRRPGFSL